MIIASKKINTANPKDLYRRSQNLPPYFNVTLKKRKLNKNNTNLTKKMKKSPVSIWVLMNKKFYHNVNLLNLSHPRKKNKGKFGL